MADQTDLRWHAVAIYRTEGGPVAAEHRFEEIEELHDIIERGPDWNCITSITITLARVSEPGQTVEKAMRS